MCKAEQNIVTHKDLPVLSWNPLRYMFRLTCKRAMSRQ